VDAGLMGTWPRPSRSALLVAAVLGIALIGLALFEPYLGKPEAGGAGPPTIHSSGPGGARALALWLGDLGYEVVSIEGRPFAVEPRVDVLFVLDPFSGLTDGHADAIAGWVERGGTLVLADDRANPLVGRLGGDVVVTSSEIVRAVPRQPLLLGPVREVEAATRARLALGGDDWVPLLGPAGRGVSVAALVSRGKGRVFLLSTLRPFSNGGIGAADNADLILALLGGQPAGATVAFDEYHHGLTEHGTLLARLVREPWGWALMWSSAAAFAYLALAGRRFGRARPDAGERPARGRGEYVATLAESLRQGRQRDWLRRAYVAQLKRGLGRRFRVGADLPAPAFVAALAARRPEAAALAEPLARLESPIGLSEAGLVEAMRRAERLRSRLVEA
jgi:hypothetical protein